MYSVQEGMIFFSYLTDFSYFSLKIVFGKLLDMVRVEDEVLVEDAARVTLVLPN
jgi:hypothetical protein